MRGRQQQSEKLLEFETHALYFSRLLLQAQGFFELWLRAHSHNRKRRPPGILSRQSTF